MCLGIIDMHFTHEATAVCCVLFETLEMPDVTEDIQQRTVLA